MNRLLQTSFWFDVQPLPFNNIAYWIIAGVFLAGIIFAIIGLGFKKKNKENKLAFKVWSKLTNFGFSFGIVGFILVFLKQQRVPYLGMRVWLILWFLICLVWLVFILKYIIIEVPRLRKEKEVHKEKEKYIPR